MSLAEAGGEPGPKSQSDGAVLPDCKVAEVPVKFLEGESVPLSEAESAAVCQFIGSLYPAGVEESLPAVPEKVASIDVLADDLESEANWGLPT